jgi:hypothetical protein
LKETASIDPVAHLEIGEIHGLGKVMKMSNLAIIQQEES